MGYNYDNNPSGTLATWIRSTAGAHTFTVPAGVTKIGYKLTGWGGWGGMYRWGGWGGSVWRWVVVTPGQQITFTIGTWGVAGWYNGSVGGDTTISINTDRAKGWGGGIYNPPAGPGGGFFGGLGWSNGGNGSGAPMNCNTAPGGSPNGWQWSAAYCPTDYSGPYPPATSWWPGSVYIEY